MGTTGPESGTLKIFFRNFLVITIITIMTQTDVKIKLGTIRHVEYTWTHLSALLKHITPQIANKLLFH